MQVQIRRKRIATLPALNLSEDFWDKVGKIAVGSIIDNIVSQKQEDGSPLKSNAASTKRRKANEGRPPLSLIDDNRSFVKGGKGPKRSFVFEKITVRGMFGLGRKRQGIAIRPNDKTVTDKRQVKKLFERARTHESSRGLNLKKQFRKRRSVNFRDLVGYVQEKGYTGWFGISAKGKAAIGALLRREIRRLFKEAAKKQGSSTGTGASGGAA